MYKIIGLASIGPQVGKTTSAKYLSKKLIDPRTLQNAKIYEMSDYIIDEIEILIPTFKILHPVVKRCFLQVWGEYKRKNIEDCYWIEKIFKSENILEEYASIISGVRSEAEAKYIIKNGGEVILLINQTIDFIDKIQDVEKQLFNVKDDKKYVTCCISNTGTLDDLYKKLDIFIGSDSKNNSFVY